MLIFVGMPLMQDGKLYNVAAALNKGDVLGFTTKHFFQIMVNFMKCVNLHRDQKKPDGFYLREIKFRLVRRFYLNVQRCQIL